MQDDLHVLEALKEMQGVSIRQIILNSFFFMLSQHMYIQLTGNNANDTLYAKRAVQLCHTQHQVLTEEI